MDRILLLRTSALGDVVHALPVLTALRRHLPRARIGWVVERVLAPLLAGHPLLDEVLEVDLRGWRRRPFRRATLRAVAGFRRRLDDFGAEVAIDLMGNHKAGALAALSGADRCIGAAHRRRREPSSALWISEGVETVAPHAVDRGLELLAALGLPREPADFGADHLFRAVPEAASELLARQDGPFVVIHPGAGWGNKRYPPALWGEVARRLGGRPGIRSLALSGPGEESLAAAIEAASGGAARAVAAPGLDFLAAMLRAARLVMAGDTGPLHLAHALGRPVLCLLGPTDPERNGPYDAPVSALWQRLPCSFCHQRLDGPRACLLNILPERVAERARRLLDAD